MAAGDFSLPRLRNPQSCDRCHTTARRRAVGNTGLGDPPHTRRGPCGRWCVLRWPRAPGHTLAIAPIFRPGSTAQEVRWSVNSEGIRYLVGARQFPRLRLRAPEHRCYLDAAWTVMPCGAARVVIDASFGGPHTAADVLPQRDPLPGRRSDFQHCSPRKIPRRSNYSRLG